MPLTLAQLEDLRAEYFAEDVPIQHEQMSNWTEDMARDFFDSGGTKMPSMGMAAAPALSGVFALPPQKLITGGDLTMDTLAGKPIFIMNVASR